MNIIDPHIAWINIIRPNAISDKLNKNILGLNLSSCSIVRSREYLWIMDQAFLEEVQKSFVWTHYFVQKNHTARKVGAQRKYCTS